MIYTPLLEMLLPRVVFQIPSPLQRTLFLTFDDGPDPYFTLKICEILEKYDVKASFFVVGKQVEKHPTIIKELYGNGHLICNHSFTHRKFYFPAKIKQDIVNNQQIINSIIEEPVNYFRPPHGRIYPGLKKALNELRLKIVLWDVFVPDYKPGFSSQKITERIIKYCQNGSIILLHDRSKNINETIKSLPNFIRTLSDRGYFFKTLPKPGDQFN